MMNEPVTKREERLERPTGYGEMYDPGSVVRPHYASYLEWVGIPQN